MKESPKLEPKTSNTVITSIGRGGGGNIFKTETSTPPHESPRLIPVTSAGNGIPADQKKFSISRGGYGNMRDNRKSSKDDGCCSNALSNVNSHVSSPDLMPISSLTSNSEVRMVPLDSVKSIGRGGFGNQIKNIKDNREAKKKGHSLIFTKITNFFK